MRLWMSFFEDISLTLLPPCEPWANGLRLRSEKYARKRERGELIYISKAE